MPRPTFPGNRRAGQGFQRVFHCLRHRIGQCRIRCDQDGLRAFIMFCLGQQIHRDMGGIIGAIGNHHHF